MILAALIQFAGAYPAHGVTGTWLDEILELGVPLVLFAGLWWWSTRKEKKRSGGAAPRPPRGSEGAQPPQR
ncbi:MAG: hypothetical protein E6H81_13485 [Chloroflexi bacterium]|nr:MAG: hypothetical protein E6H81_13485 [Chloroflexota bacterium]